MNEKNSLVWWKKLDELAEKLDNITLWDRRFISDCLHKRQKSGWTPNKKQRGTLNEIWKRVFVKEKFVETLWEDDLL